MTDRELLELAAKAVELPECGWMGPAFMYVKDNTFTDWNPLADDGDALRLAVKLSMNVVVKTLPHAIYVEAYNGQAPAVVETLADVREKDFDPYSATRRAITRAAAEIGRNMK